MQGNNIPVLTPLTCEAILEVQCLKVLGLWTINLNGIQAYINLALTDKHLLYFHDASSLSPSYFCPLNFDLKFEILRETPWKDEQTPGKPYGIRFEKQLPNKQFQVLEIYSIDSSLIYTWKLYLESKINQRGFHKLFRSKKQIGKGAFAAVYLAEQLEDKKLVAVKAFSKQRQFQPPHGKQSLINQINLMRKFHHPNVMQIYGVYETQNSIYVILEMLQGRQLYNRLKNNEIKNPKDIAQVTKNILQALKVLAEKRVIHRDLKPQNIMFKKEGTNNLAICDFGLATYADQEKYLFVRCGTPGYVAPEIINIKDMSTKSDPISDVFSAGLIFHYLLFGRSIFDGKKYQEILHQNRACSFNFQKDLYKSADAVAMDLLKRLLDVNPLTRISAANALHHPYFDQRRYEAKMLTSEMECENMIDQKQQDLSTVAGSKRPYSKAPDNSILNGGLVLRAKKKSYHGSIYQKQNEIYQLGLNKKISLGDQVQIPLRRSKRTSVQERKSYYNHLRY